MIKRALIIDTESTSLDSESGCIIEVGAIVYSLVNRTILSQFSTLLPLITTKTIEPQAMEVNRIPISALREVDKIDVRQIHGLLCQWMDMTDIAVAHYVEHDRGFLRQIGIDCGNFVDTASDFTWPKTTSRILTQIAISYGIPVIDPHRALDDCRLIASLFDKQEDLQGMFDYALLPKEVYVSSLPFDKNDINKANGFIWDRLVPRCWARKMTADEASALNFRVSKVTIV